MKTKFLFLLLLSLCIISCGDSDDDLKPITLKDREGSTISLSYPNETKYSFPLQGGDGTYTVKSGNDEVIKVEMISAIDFRIEIIGLGTTKITITDKSQNVLILDVIVDYQTDSYVIKQHDIAVFGDDLTTNEKKAISEKYIAEVPVKAGGGYKFTFSDKPNESGKAIIYTDSYGGSKGIETTFQLVEIKNKNIPESASWGYEVEINSEKRVLIPGRYFPLARSTERFPVALHEDITQKVQKEYPKAELVYISQIIDIP